MHIEMYGNVPENILLQNVFFSEHVHVEEETKGQHKPLDLIFAASFYDK